MSFRYGSALREPDEMKTCISSGNKFRLTEVERVRGEIKCPKCGHVMKIDPKLTVVVFVDHSKVVR
jgi:predicted RNA-binding Zn-ribbon protein involved in translation (DUF1610 family)